MSTEGRIWPTVSRTPWIGCDSNFDDGPWSDCGASRADGQPDADVDPASPVLQLYTAAFTGRPNGALLSHTACLTQSVVMGMLQDVSSEYVYLNSGPLFHVATT